MNKDKQKLEKLQRENERLVQKFWTEFYDIKNLLNKNFDITKESNIKCNKGS